MPDLENAACKGLDPGYWDTVTRRGRTSRLGSVKMSSGRLARSKQIAYAKYICSTCPVITQCLLAGKDEEEGIWGGKLPDER